MTNNLRKITAFLLIIIATITIISCDKTTTTLPEATSELTTSEVTTGVTTSDVSSVVTTTEATTTGATTTRLTTITELTTIEMTTMPITTQQPTTTYISTTSEITTTRELITYTGIEVTRQDTKCFNIGDPFDKSSFVLVAHLSNGEQEVISSELINVRGYDSSAAGTKNLTIIFDRFFVSLKVYILEDYAFGIDMDYYEETINLKGDYLKVILNNILHEDFIPLLYGEARYILPVSDVDPNNSSNLMLIYTGDSVDSSWDSGLTWNREHVWPQSRLGVSVSYTDDFPSKATDIHNLKPADPGENASRSNDYFSDVDGLDFYVPRDEVKGDVARILFYMSTMYTDLTLDDDKDTLSAYKTMGMLSLLLEWNHSDPVDEFEMYRNEILYSYQGNRNPYIDYPEYADLIWGDLAN
ncbi:endonuclease [Mycoplasmatota bacterium WC30]